MIVVIPAYEPDQKLVGVVKELHEETDYSVIVVDDGSGEEYREIFDAVAPMAHVLRHDVNRGKGAAMKTAFGFIKDNDMFDRDDGIITADADGQHLLKDIVRVSEEWALNKDALVLGGRKFTGNVPLRSRMGNGITRFVFAVTTGVRVYDTQTGLRAFSVRSLDTMLGIAGDRYEYEINQLLYCTKHHIKIDELPIETVYLNKNESSHFNTVRDSWRIYKTIFSFMGASFISWIVDYVLLLGLNGIFRAITRGNDFTVFDSTIDTKLPAIIIARIVSSIVNYTLNRKVVFKSGNKLSMLLYFITAIVVLAANYLLLKLFDKAGIPLWLAQILAQLIVYPLSFVFQRKIVFKDENKQEA